VEAGDAEVAQPGDSVDEGGGGVPALLQPKHGVRQPMKLPTILLDCVTELGRLRCGLASMEVGIDGGGGEKCL
jgi:hypothetical protein